MSEAELQCPACHAAFDLGDRFCEQCGARLIEEDAAEAVTEHRVELDLIVAAAVSDRGRVHRRNEDAFHLEVLGSGEIAAVVCDGISTASAGDAAARSAARAAGAALAQASGADAVDGGRAMTAAIAAARGSVGQVPWTTRTERGMPSCTLVSALCRDGEIVIGSVGDSRAYWIDAGGPRQLTVDESWAEEKVADGVLSPEEAFRDPRSHSITNWVGADAPERPPRLTVLRPDGPGRLLLCTDGLWNYVATPGELGRLMDELPAGASPAAVARALTDTAVIRGGRDNITVAVVDIDPT